MMPKSHRRHSNIDNLLDKTKNKKKITLTNAVNRIEIRIIRKDSVMFACKTLTKY